MVKGKLEFERPQLLASFHHFFSRCFLDFRVKIGSQFSLVFVVAIFVHPNEPVQIEVLYFIVDFFWRDEARAVFSKSRTRIKRVILQIACLLVVLQLRIFRVYWVDWRLPLSRDPRSPHAFLLNSLRFVQELLPGCRSATVPPGSSGPL